jgi:hypothetical protein
MATENASGVREDEVQLGYGKGGVPWLLLLFYLGFLGFFTWYVLEYQLPDFLRQGPVVQDAPALRGSGE